jgi:hypothetical protein
MEKTHTICVEPLKYGGYMIYDENDRSILVQSDWDYPGLANSFGWSPSMAGRQDCPDGCRGTDGTVKCPDCGTDAGVYIAAAADYLDSCSLIVEDPGYFGGDDE